MAFPADRPGTYDEDKFWDEESGAWYTTSTATGVARLKQAGGRYRNQFIVISGQAEIYFGDIQGLIQGLIKMAFPPDRPGSYDENETWKESTEEWVSTDLKRSGGRYKTQIVVLSEQRQIYFGDV